MSETAFTEEQDVAIRERESAYALAANAGSGKTSVLVERFVRAVIDDGIAPGRILAISFTDRAAGELRRRVRRRLLDADRREAAAEAAGAFIATFHGFCARLLRSHSQLVGLAPGFAVLTDSTAAALNEAAFEQAQAVWLERDGALDLAAMFGEEELRGAILGVYDELRSRGEAAPRLPEPRLPTDEGEARRRLAGACTAMGGELAGAKSTGSVDTARERLASCAELLAGEREPTREEVAELALGGQGAALKTPVAAAYEAARAAYEQLLADRLGVAAVELLGGLLEEFGRRYAALKAARGSADFDDLELEALALLEAHPEVATLWRERFERLMVDELQDTNARQLAILRLLERDNLFTVGDQHQSIYGFRHADVGLFRARQAELEARGRAGVLSANFRSATGVIGAVNAVFKPLFGGAFAPLTPGRTDADNDTPVELLLTAAHGWDQLEAELGSELAPAPLWRRAEARLLAARIDELIRSGAAQADDIVILMRAGTTIGVYESALADLGHLTLATAGGGFYERPEVADLAAYVRALANPLDDIALYGMLASPLCGASADQIARLVVVARERGLTAAEALAQEPTSDVLEAFGVRFAAARRRAGSMSLAEIVAAAVAEHGYDLYLCQLHAPARRLANVRKLVRLAREYERREGRDLRRFAHALGAGRLGALRELEAPPDAAGGGAVRLMTVHTAKGLEFPVVALADLGHGAVADGRRLLVDGERIGVSLPSVERAWFPALDYSNLREERQARERDEERRVMYVAMTRARERLILSGSANFENWPGNPTKAIEWLGPALVPDLAARAAAAYGGGEEALVDGELVSGADGIAVRLTLNTAAALPTLLAATRGAADDARFASAAVPRASRVAVVAAPSATQLSYTALADYERCAYRYYLQRVLRMPDVAAPLGDGQAGGEDAALRGVYVHALLEQLDFAAPRPPGAAAHAAAERVAGAALADPVAAGELAFAFARSPLCARLAAAGDVRREAPFAFVFGPELLISGFFDAVGCESDGTLLVVDYKTDKLIPGEDLAAHVERDYSLQQLIYSLAALESGAASVEIAYCFLRSPEQVVCVRHVAADGDRLMAELRARQKPLRDGSFDVSPQPGWTRCSTCPGRARLCSHEEAATLAGGPAS